MLTDAQTKKITFTLSHTTDGDFFSRCSECKATLLTYWREGIAAHNRSKAAHREKHKYGYIPSPSIEKEPAS